MPQHRAAAVHSSSLVRVVCDRSLPPDESLGQNFLVDWDVVDREVDAADVGDEDRVLEIGPGMGALTAALAEQAGSVVAIEKDDRFEPLLSAIAESSGNVEVVYGDALDYDLAGLRFDKVVANLPFGVSLPILFDLRDAAFEVAVLLVQRDLAERVTTAPGEPGYNRLSVQFARHADLRRLGGVDPAAFYPPPDVDGELLELRPVAPKFDVPSEAFFKDVLMFLFSGRELPVRAALGRLADLDAASVDAGDVSGVADRVETVADEPVENVSPEAFGAVARALHAVVGSAVADDFEAFYDAEGLYKRARGEN